MYLRLKVISTKDKGDLLAKSIKDTANVVKNEGVARNGREQPDHRQLLR